MPPSRPGQSMACDGYCNGLSHNPCNPGLGDGGSKISLAALATTTASDNGSGRALLECEDEYVTLAGRNSPVTTS